MNVGYIAASFIKRNCRQAAWLTSDQLFSFIQLIGVYMCIRYGVVVSRRLEAGQVLQHQSQGSVLHHVGRHAYWSVARSLVHVQMQALVDYPNMHPAVAGCNGVALPDPFT